MDSPVRKMQKRNDYNRHKLFRKIRRRRRAQAELLSRIAEKELKKKLRVTPVKYGDGKVDNTQNYIGPFRPLSYAQEFSDTLKESVQKASNHLKQNQAINTAKKLSKRHVSTVLHIGGNAEQVREKFWKQEPVLDHAVDSIANEYGINPEILKYRINKEGFVDRAVRLNNTAAGSEYKYSDPGGYSLLHSPIFTGPGDFGLDDYAYYVENGVRPINENWETVDFVNEKKRRTAAATGETVADNMGMVASLLRYFAQQAKHDYPSLSDYDLNRYALAYYNRGQAGGRKWAENGAKGYEFRPKGFMLMPQYAYKDGKTTGYVRDKNDNPVAFNTKGGIEGLDAKEPSLSYGYPVYWSDEVPSNYRWAKEYLKGHPDVTGFAVGGGAQGPEDMGQKVIIRNSHSNILPDHNDSRWYGLDKIEAIRHYMGETGYVPNFETSPEQDKFRRDNFSNEDPYGRDDTAWKQSVISRITADKEIDKEFGVTPEQFRDYANIMRGLNSKMDNLYNIPTGYRGGYYLPEVTISGNKHSVSGYKNGKTSSGIHIKPSHRGRLTALKKRTGKSEAELYRTGSAATRKMITFARNARKWNK